jgi:hypothetical protein
MQSDPAEEFQRLSALYAEMGEIELGDLASSYDGLTETAQQVLRSEMLKRGLRDPAAPPAPVRDQPRPARPDASGAEALEGEDGDCDFTWKVLLVECDEWEKAWQIHEVLRRAGVDSWLEKPHSGANWDLRVPRVMVAADQLDEARQIAAQPISQEIVDLSRQQVPEYEPPTCPACGALDPILGENHNPEVEPNHWICDYCGNEWDDVAGESEPLLPKPPEMGKSIL